LEAVFVKIFNFNVKTTTGGTIDNANTSTYPLYYDENDMVKAKANASTNYRFDKWTWTNAVGTNQESLDNPYEFAITEDIELTAHFIRQYTYAVSASAGGMLLNLTSTANGTYDINKSIHCEIDPTATTSGYLFIGWY
jgi:hypothetical protein